MGTISSNKECPNCKSLAEFQLNYKTQEFFIICDSCGYSESHNIKRDEDFNPIIENNEYVWERDINDNPYGCYIISSDNISELGSLTQEGAKDFIKQVIENKISVTINRFVDGEFIKENYE